MPYKGTTFRKPEVHLVQNEFGHYWTAIFPTQMHKEESKQAVLKNLAQVIQHIRDGKIDFLEVNMLAAKKTTRFAGGITRILSHLPGKKRIRRRKKVSK